MHVALAVAVRTRPEQSGVGPFLNVIVPVGAGPLVSGGRHCHGRAVGDGLAHYRGGGRGRYQSAARGLHHRHARLGLRSEGGIVAGVIGS